jgi:hypothetical protein
MEVCFLVLEPVSCCEIGLCKLQLINFEFSTLRRCSEPALSLSKGQVLGFWIPTESALKFKNQFAIRRFEILVRF